MSQVKQEQLSVIEKLKNIPENPYNKIGKNKNYGQNRNNSIYNRRNGNQLSLPKEKPGFSTQTHITNQQITPYNALKDKFCRIKDHLIDQGFISQDKNIISDNNYKLLQQKIVLENMKSERLKQKNAYKEKDEVILPRVNQQSLYTNRHQQNQMFQLQHREMIISSKRKNNQGGSRVQTELIHQDQENGQMQNNKNKKISTEVLINNNPSQLQSKEDLHQGLGTQKHSNVVSKEDFMSFLNQKKEQAEK